ncbi:protein POLR1D isoform X2 [Bombina bombina]|uniref:protein POLR1D isoform X2 n=1 Tax=Bombina bombina TaxID=8345 RepID=UPI00235A660D|nr:protein POLR1D isoform X2 [Bombina bombina]
MAEADLERKAIEELLNEAERGKTRVETMGPMGWMKCPVAPTNKRFLMNTIRNTLPQKGKKDLKENDKKKTDDYSKEKTRSSRKGRTHPYRSDRSEKEKRL